MIHTRIYFLIDFSFSSRRYRVLPRINYFTDVRYQSGMRLEKRGSRGLGVYRVYIPTAYTAPCRCVIESSPIQVSCSCLCFPRPSMHKPETAPVAKVACYQTKVISSQRETTPASRIPCSYSKVCASFSPSPSCPCSGVSTPLSILPVSSKTLLSILTGLN